MAKNVEIFINMTKGESFGEEDMEQPCEHSQETHKSDKLKDTFVFL